MARFRRADVILYVLQHLKDWFLFQTVGLGLAAIYAALLISKYVQSLFRKLGE